MTERPSSQGWQRNVWALSLCVFIAFVGFSAARAEQWAQPYVTS